MTLILVLPAESGIVVASDGQITAGPIRSTGQKIFKLNDTCVWSASGELALIQRVGEALASLPAGTPLTGLRDQIASIVNQSAGALLQLDFRTRFFANDPHALLQLHPADFVFVEAAPERAVLHVHISGTPEWVIDRPFATGTGDMFAYALLQKYQGRKLSLEKASLLAFKVVEEAIEVGAYGLGYPIDIWHVTSDGARQLGEDEKAALQDAARLLRDREIELLVADSLEP